MLIRLKPGKTIRGRLESEVLSSKIFDRVVSKILVVTPKNFSDMPI